MAVVTETVVVAPTSTTSNNIAIWRPVGPNMFQQVQSFTSIGADFSGFTGENRRITAIMFRTAITSSLGRIIANVSVGGSNNQVDVTTPVVYDFNFSEAAVEWFNLNPRSDVLLQQIGNATLSSTSQSSSVFLAWAGTAGSRFHVTFSTYSADAPTDFFPTSGTLNPHTPLRFEWTFTPAGPAGEIQTGSKIEYSINNAEWIGTDIPGFANAHTFPAATFPQGANVRLRVRATSNFGTSEWAGPFSFTMRSFTLPAPRSFFPSSGRLAAGEANFFSWEYQPSESPLDVQTGSTIETSVNNGPWTRTVLNNTANNHTFPAGTWPHGANIRIRLFTRASIGGVATESPLTSIFNFTTHQTSPPTTLSPDDTARNPRQTVEYTWQHVPAQGFADDRQTASIFRRRTNGGAWTETTLNNALNTHTTPPSTFTNGNIVEWQVRTVSNAGTSEWSEMARFTIAITPPLAPAPVFPVDVSVSPVNGIFLAWNYNSSYDNNPSRFDIEFRIGGGAWQTRQTAGQVSLFLEESLFPEEQSTVSWRVRGYGEFGDIGPWSNTVTFWTRGVPPRPAVTHVTNSSRPVVTFSAQVLMSYQLEILHHGQVIYAASRPFNNIFTHNVARFLANGTYAARLRVSNEYGLFSNWAELAFTVNVEAPPTVTADVSSSAEFAVDVFIDGADFGQFRYFVYRAEAVSPDEAETAKNAAIPIGRADESLYRDFTAAPDSTYLYFVRTVSHSYNFADSNFITVRYRRLETMLAPVSRLDDVVTLLVNIGGKPQKAVTTGIRREFVTVLGREFPVIEVGTNKNKHVAHSFFVDTATAGRLKEWANSGEVFCLRDRRYGTVFGTFGGDISFAPESDGFRVSFDFAAVDFKQEVTI